MKERRAWTWTSRLLGLSAALLLPSVFCACGVDFVIDSSSGYLAGTDRLNTNEHLHANEQIASGNTVLAFQGDGNLVLYQNGQAIWASNKFGTPSEFSMQGDCNAVAYKSGGVLWASNTSGQGSNCHAQVVPGDWMVCSGTTRKWSAKGVGTCTTGGSGGSQPGGYKGCYTDSSSRALPAGQGSGFDNDTCKARCLSLNYAYAGSQYGGECWCGNSLAYSKVSDSECSMACAVNPAQFCGAGYRNSIYSTGYTPPGGGCPGTVLAGAGDIASPGSLAAANGTGTYLNNLKNACGGSFRAFSTGDTNQEGSDWTSTWYEQTTWRNFKSSFSPARGNHDRGSGWNSYFGVGDWYAYSHGSWRFIVLDSEQTGSSSQLSFLEGELNANKGGCVGVYFHKPRWTSGTSNPPEAYEAMKVWWDKFVYYGADMVLSGHNHQFEVFRRMGRDGENSYGPRQFVVGTGGYGLYGFGSPLPGSEIRRNDSHGVFKVVLGSGGYDWEWVPVDQNGNQSGSSTSGHEDCHAGSGGGGGGGGCDGGAMTANSAVRGCQGYREETSSQPSANACATWCKCTKGAPACEWNGITCWAEWGTGCFVQGGFGGWWAKVF